MPVNFYETHTLLMAVNQMTPPASFLRDRYFRTNPATDVFSTQDVLCETKFGSKKMAPFVVPRKNGVAVMRDGSSMKRYTPPNIAPKRSLTIDDLEVRGFGEALYSQLTPEQRQQQLVLGDINDLSDYITRREEYMAAQVMATGGVVMEHIADDPSLSETKEVRFWPNPSAAYPYVTQPTYPWDNPTQSDPIADLKAVVQRMVALGNTVSDLVCSPAVADMLINHPKVLQLLDINRYNLGEVNARLLDPVKYPAASIVAILNIDGRNINVISYGETYTDDTTGLDTGYIPADKCILCAPGAGRTAYGAVTQVEQNDGLAHTYTGIRVPKYVSSAEGNARTVTLTSRPLLIPNRMGAFWTITADF